MTAGDFDALFDEFTSTVVRLETLPEFRVGGAEQERIDAWRAGRPRPLRSVATDPWLARIARTTMSDGKVWRRVRILEDPPTEYQRYQLAGYVEAQTVGDQVRVAIRPDVLDDDGPDFWLFDEGLPTARAAVMHYDAEGRWLGWDLVAEASALAELGERVRRVDAVAVPLNEYLARKAGNA